MKIFEIHDDSKSSKIYYVTALFLAVVMISAAGYGYIRQQHFMVIEDARHELETVSDLKAAQLVQWRKERLQEAQSIHANAMVSHRINDYLSAIEKEKALKEIRDWMESLHSQAGYSKILLFRQDGEIITSISESQEQPQRHYLNMVNEAVQKQEIIFTDFHQDNEQDTIDIDLFIPIMHHTGDTSECIAVLVIDINPFRQLYPLIRYWPTPSSSAESLLVKRDGNDVLYLSQLRYQSAPLLTFRKPLTNKEMPAARAALGQEGVFDGLDYRGVPVYASIRKIPDSPWAIIAKIDTEEILEPATERMQYVIFICLMALAVVGLGINLGWSRKKAANLHHQYEAELKLTNELRQAEQELQEAHDKLEVRVLERTKELDDKHRQLFEAQRLAHIGNWNWNIATDTVSWSEQTYAITGRDPEQRNIKYVDQVTLYTPASWLRLDSAVKKTLESGKPYELELDLIRTDGVYRICIARGEANYDDNGHLIELYGTLQDVTERFQLERQLAQSKKLETIGQLAAGVAHEVRNPLNAILSISEALFKEAEIEENPLFTPYIQHIRTQVKRLAQLMNDLLELGKPIPAASLEPVHLFNLCRETINLWNSSGSASKVPVLLTADSDPSDIYISADALKLQQIIFNLLENASQNSVNTEPIKLKVIEADSTGLVGIQVIDAGKGIRLETLARVFEPFYTERREGTGLGLALVKHFILSMGGTVTIYNNDPPPGCTAEIRLVRAQKEQT